jgi:hypothetical protein
MLALAGQGRGLVVGDQARNVSACDPLRQCTVRHTEEPCRSSDRTAAATHSDDTPHGEFDARVRLGVEAADPLPRPAMATLPFVTACRDYLLDELNDLSIVTRRNNA